MKRLVRIAGESMAPTYRPDDLLLTRPPGPTGPQHADVAVFRSGGLRMVKRVVGLPGDLVELEAGRLFVNGGSIDGRRRVPGALTQTWRVPPAHYFMTGDNSAASDDSRVWDEPFVPAERIESVVALRAGIPRRRRGLTARPPAAVGGRGA